MFNKICVILFLILLASCGHHRDVRPGTGGVHRVVVHSEERETAERSAISQAEHYCSQSNKGPEFLEEKTEYKGTMNEGTRETIHKASNAAMVLGGMGTAAGRGNTQTGGSVLGSAGVAGHIMTNGKDYVSDMRFRCQ